MSYAVKTILQLREHLRSLRRDANLTQKGLGLRLGLGQVRIAEIESNPGSVSAEQLLQVVHALGAELVIRPGRESDERDSAGGEATAKPNARPTAKPMKVSEEVVEVAQKRLSELLHTTEEQAEDVVTSVLKWGGHPPDHQTSIGAYDIRTTVLDKRNTDELRYWCQALGVEEETLIGAVRAVGVRTVLDGPAKTNRGSW